MALDSIGVKSAQMFCIQRKTVVVAAAAVDPVDPLTKIKKSPAHAASDWRLTN